MTDKKVKKNQVAPSKDDRVSSSKSLLRNPKRSIRVQDVEERTFKPSDGDPGTILAEYRAELLEGADLNLKFGTATKIKRSILLHHTRNTILLSPHFGNA